MKTKFTTTIYAREFPNGFDEPKRTSPRITFTVEADEDFPVDPDRISWLLGDMIGRLVTPKGESSSIKSEIDPWPLPKDWTAPNRSKEP